VNRQVIHRVNQLQSHQAKVRDLGTAVAWNNVGGWSIDTWYDSPSIVSILQTQIDKVGWASGQNLTIHLVDNSSTSGAERSGRSRDYGTAYSAELIVNYT